jgi:hypothetical protein
LQWSVATSALFPALPLPSMVKLNTDLKVAALFQLMQTETKALAQKFRNLNRRAAVRPSAHVAARERVASPLG